MPALGCTEPIAIALAAAHAAKALGQPVQRLVAQCSGNVIKNVQGVVVPASGGRRGVEIAAALGAVCTAPERGLEVLSGIDEKQRAAALTLAPLCEVQLFNTEHKLHILMTAHGGGHIATAEIRDTHTNVVKVTLDEAVLAESQLADAVVSTSSRAFMSVRGILDFAATVPAQEISPVLERQISCNTAISNEGLSNEWGAQVGKILREVHGNHVENRAKAAAAAGSDARMSGCELPVIINSGSGNQGLTVSLPVIEYAGELGSSHEELLRALAVSNLTAIHLKSGIGKLSAYCGAVCAAVGAGAGIAFLQKEAPDVIESVIINTLADVSGIVCDGAKPSCAAKIASSLDAALLALNMAKRNFRYGANEGIVKQDVEQSIRAVGALASEGMQETDRVVLKIMVGQHTPAERKEPS